MPNIYVHQNVDMKSQLFVLILRSHRAGPGGGSTHSFLLFGVAGWGRGGGTGAADHFNTSSDHFLFDSFPGAWSNPWPSWPCGARPCSPGGGRPHRAHCCPLQVSSLVVVVAVDLSLLALPFFGFGLLMLSFIVDLHCCYNDLIIIVIKCFSCGIFASFNAPTLRTNSSN